MTEVHWNTFFDLKNVVWTSVLLLLSRPFGMCDSKLLFLTDLCSCSNFKTACSEPLGMEDGSITDNMTSASSTHQHSQTSWGRLHHLGGSWTPLDDYIKSWFQVNFEPEVKRITGIATQGRGKEEWFVKKYYIMYKKKGDWSLKTYMENNHTVVSWTSCL